MREEGHPKYRLIDELLSNPRRLLISIIIGNDISNIVASALATPLAVHQFGPAGRWVAIAVMTTIIVTVCDITPKVLAISHPATVSSLVARPVSIFLKWISPVRWVVQITVDAVLKAVGLPGKKKARFLLEKDFLRLVEHSHNAGAVDRLERDFIRRVVYFSETRVTSIMTPRMDVFALSAGTTLSEAAGLVKKKGFSRVPVYDGDINHILGTLHIKNLLGLEKSLAEKTLSDIRSRLKPVYYVPESTNVHDLFRDLQARHIHLAVIVDEYGDVSGLVTMEDILEELFGEIYDEYDQRGIIFEEKENGVFLVSPRALIDDFNEILGTSIPSGQVETIGGFVLDLFGELPHEGSQAAYNGLVFTVVKLRGTSILQLKVQKTVHKEIPAAPGNTPLKASN